MSEEKIFIDSIKDEQLLWSEGEKKGLLEILYEMIIQAYKKDQYLEFDVKERKIYYKFKNRIATKVINCTDKEEYRLSTTMRMYTYMLFYTFFNYVNLNKKEKMDFKDKIMMRMLSAILHLLSLEHIFIVGSEIILKLAQKEYSRQKTSSNGLNMAEENIKTTFTIIRKVEAMGLYCKEIKLNDDLIVQLNNKLNVSEWKDKIFHNIIFICPEHQNFFFEQLSIEEQLILTKPKLHILVFSHELGHLIFSNVKKTNRRIRERQANLVSSYLNNGSLDAEIKIKTDQQLNEYQEPLLLSNKIIDYKKFLEEYEELYNEEV